ncbi:RNA polymerase sigma-70 factor, ECF subfamily [Mariniphaga anaerophila]|uniref:RNA polymerase sigma-70 factor, ECF subfamily n=1 Tax=Mariniphaga anaerophila TaxID=1484053 RepID=A0A1M5EF01_9BACT|nr:RNA polymerase sigma-70 factor [Mariniphaga anaerophila]SHF77740.1 RNA polymerase sigma-70 factor, ECF subfamily [Mariniphaga anaerophila]
MSTFDQIFLKYYHSLLLYGLKFIRDENDVHDIVQEVFVTVWEKEKYTFSDAHLKSYLFNSVRNGCLNHIRHQSVVNKHIEKQELSLLINELNFYGSGEKSLIEKESLKEIYAAIESLPPKQKEMIELSRFEGLKNKEIAEKLGIPLRTVETRLFRALSGLRKVLTGKQIYILLNLVVRHKADNP